MDKTDKTADEGVREFVIPISLWKSFILRGDVVVRARTKEDAEFLAKEAAEDFMIFYEDYIGEKMKEYTDLAQDLQDPRVIKFIPPE